MVTLRQIRNFLVLCDTLHFARAAEKLEIAPAVLSKEIIKMENTLKFKLFDRSDKRNIRLTEAGKAYWCQVQDLPGKLESACSAGRKTAAGEKGDITVAISGISCRFFDLESICRRLQSYSPEINLSLREIYTPRQTLEQLERNFCDIAIFPFIPELSPSAFQESFEFRTAGNYFLNYILPRSHHLAAKEEIDPRDVVRTPLILPSREFAPGLRKFLDKYFMMQTDLLPQPAYEVDGPWISSRMIAAGLGIGIFAGAPFYGELDQQKIIVRSFHADINIKNIIVWKAAHQTALLSKIVALFQNSVRKQQEAPATDTAL